jgi:hypothetical protein
VLKHFFSRGSLRLMPRMRIVEGHVHLAWFLPVPSAVFSAVMMAGQDARKPMRDAWSILCLTRSSGRFAPRCLIEVVGAFPSLAAPACAFCTQLTVMAVTATQTSAP